MTTNEFYYNDGVLITREEAHALRDKSKLVVADESKTKAQCLTALGVSE
ncbi:hypothetical protein LCGC14_2174110 [marine sediment metagenome]|uniref:Uncharacterized protein n=1 Tax=marine sediment metagenome TaxID=412755 RepID=A0A0F9DP88_9ZZZZ